MQTQMESSPIALSVSRKFKFRETVRDIEPLAIGKVNFDKIKANNKNYLQILIKIKSPFCFFPFK